jgi:hypothetical protein
MTTSERYVEEPDLAVAWARALLAVSAQGRKETGPLVVSITGFDKSGCFREEPAIRTAVDQVLAREGLQTVETVAGTIFPWSMWNRSEPSRQLFDRYRNIAPRLRQAVKNRRGTYFERMITGGPPGKENQLEFAIETYRSRTAVRRSVLQVAVFNPNQDHSTAAQLGFPCLQHVTFAPIDGGLCVNAFYATQYMVERAYGNYVGLCRLGQFAAHELDLHLIRMTCFTGIAQCEAPRKKLAGLMRVVNELVGQPERPEAGSETVGGE